MSNIDYSKARGIGGVYSARLIYQMKSNNILAVISGTGSHKTFIFEVTKNCKRPFQRDKSQIGSDGILCPVYIR